MSQVYEFGPYRLEVATRRLLRDGEAVALTPKAFDTLLALVERRDRVVDKAELMKLVWSDSFVEEANLSQTIFILRKTLGDDANGRPFIDTVPRRGYRFTADVRVGSLPSARRRSQLWKIAAIFAVAAAALSVWDWTAVRGRHASADVLAGKTRVVVLPFENLTRDRKDDWLANAFSESLTAGLESVEGLICVSRDRIVELYRQEAIGEASAVDAKSLRRMSQILGVRYYVHGSYQKVGDRIRVVAQLVESNDGAIRAQETASDDFINLLKLEDNLTSRFCAKLASQRTATMRPETSSLEAYQAVVEAGGAYAASNPHEARDRLLRAVQLDPQYATAWALLSKTEARLAAGSTFVGGSLSELHRTALASAERAVALAPSLYEAHTALALAYREVRQYDLWRRESETAIALNPRVAEAYELLADWYAAVPGFGCSHGYDPQLAERYYRTALRIDPRFGAAWGNFIYHLHFARPIDEALRVADEAVGALPESRGVRRARATALMFGNRLSDAEQEVRGIPERERSVQDQWVLATVALIRNDADAPKRLDDVLRQMPSTTWDFSIARSYFIANRVEEGMTYVDRAVQRDPACAEYAATVPAFAPYRDTPAFRARLAAWKSRS